MSISRTHITNQRTVTKRIQEMNDLLSSFMMNQTTPHLRALSSLIKNKSNNHRGQPKMGTTLIFEWKASTRMSQSVRRTKKVFDSKQYDESSNTILEGIIKLDKQ